MIDTKPSAKSFMIPQRGAWPSFEEVAGIVQVGMCFDLSVNVVCFSPHSLERWQAHMDGKELIKLFDISELTLPAIRPHLLTHKADITVLSGARAALMSGRTSSSFISQLVAAVPDGMVIAI
ncbi:MAG: hypothetical protein AAF902_09250 [Chloroflexota bacterium]